MTIFPAVSMPSSSSFISSSAINIAVLPGDSAETVALKNAFEKRIRVTNLSITHKSGTEEDAKCNVIEPRHTPPHRPIFW